MALVVDAGGAEPYHEIDVDVASLEAWSAELHRLSGLARAAGDAVGHRTVDGFAGNGPPGSLRLRDLNAEALAALATAVEQLDGLIARLRSAASQVATAYTGADAYAKVTVESVQAVLSSPSLSSPSLSSPSRPSGAPDA